ncbi:PA2169 family four-helix-bundle protein [Novosphingobium sp.]|uniref:PA2169 family four-helix-bundle protein n=1 Tax=Novosphingobium sp. TaxID=1874826 RepID=UPI003D0CF929
MSLNTEISKLDDLIVTTIDSVKGYDHSAQKAAGSIFAELLTALADERRSIVTLLQDQSRALGGEPNDFGSAAATIHRRFEDLRVAIGGGDAAIVKEIERGENYLKEEFERALKDDNISATTRATIDRCYQIIVAGRTQIEQLDAELTDNHA